jgi:hypothetical protein
MIIWFLFWLGLESERTEIFFFINFFFKNVLVFIFPFFFYKFDLVWFLKIKLNNLDFN